MYFDDLPVWGMVGEPRSFHDPSHDGTSSSEYIYTEKKLSISYNGNRVIEVNMSSDGLEPLEVRLRGKKCARLTKEIAPECL